MANFTAHQIHKQMYPGTYNFKDEEDGTSGTDINFITGVTTNTVEITSDWQSHRKVLKCTSAGGGSRYRAYHEITAQASGDIEFWIGTTDATNNHNLYFATANSLVAGNIACRVYIVGDKLYAQHGDGVGGLTTVDMGTIADNEIAHIRIHYDTTTDKQSIWREGTNYIDEENFCSDNDFGASDLDTIILYGPDVANAIAYYDAFGFSWDTDYKIGDNVYHRHYKDQDSDFESEDWGTTGTTIACVDGGNDSAHCEIVPEFNEHKKVLRFFDDDGSSDFYIGLTQATADILELCLKVTDATTHFKLYFCEDATQCFYLKIENDNLYDTDDGDIGDIADATWAHLRVQWYADNTYDVYLNNVFILDGDAMDNNQVSGINRLHVYGYGNDAAKYIYLDAISQISISGNEIGDNRTFEYHTQSYDDITTNITECRLVETEYEYSIASIADDGTITLSALHILRLFDVNGALRFEGNLFTQDQPGVFKRYIFHSLNKGELEEHISYTAAAAEDVNATLLAILTNVGQADGRLIYYTEDDPAGNYTPNYRNRPLKDVLRWTAIKGNKTLIIKPNGVCFLDSDHSSGYTITESSGEIMDNPLIRDITNQINYVKVEGAIDPDTGAPFYGVSEDTTAQADGTGIIRFYRRYRDIQSDADCASMAAAIRTGTGFSPQHIFVQLVDVYGYAGSTLSFAYSHKSFSATTSFFENVSWNIMTGLGHFTFNTGIFDAVGMAQPTFTYADETTDDIIDTIHGTDIIAIEGRLMNGTGCTWFNTNEYLQSNAVNDAIIIRFLLGDKVDTSRTIKIYLAWKRGDANADSVDILRQLIYYRSSGTGGSDNIWIAIADTLPVSAQNLFKATSWEAPATELEPNDIIELIITQNEAGDTINYYQATLEYYQKRVI